MENNNIPTLIELIKYYKEGALPDEKVFKYQSATGVHLIHRDELQKEVALSSIYGDVHKNKIIGVKTRK